VERGGSQGSQLFICGQLGAEPVVAKKPKDPHRQVVGAL
jgi:hypothetical protein